jgi:hypothetical protein
VVLVRLERSALGVRQAVTVLNLAPHHKKVLCLPEVLYKDLIITGSFIVIYVAESSLITTFVNDLINAITFL